MITKIENISLYDGKGNVLTASSIVFDEQNILAIGEDANQEVADVVVDGTGLSCLPGMIDLHVHLNMDATPDPAELIIKDNEGMAAYRSLNNLWKHGQAGVTTVRNCGSKYNVDVTLRDAIQEGIFFGPRIYASGEPIVMTGGHCHYFAIEADGEDEVRKAARTQIKNGVDVLKLMATGGGLTRGVKPGASQLTKEEMLTACTEACRAGKTTAAHAQGNEGIKNAIKAGVTTIEHGVYLDDEAIHLMLEHGTYLVATLAAPYNVVKHGVEAGIPAFAVEKNIEASVPHRESFKAAYKSGVKIATGTDAGTPFNFHGDFVTELEIMKELGMSIQEIIKAATYTAAEALGVEDLIGSLEIGKAADIVLVKGEISENISTIRNVHSVYINGKKV